MDTVLVSFIIIISSGQQPTNSQNGTENSQDGIVKGDSHEKDRCPSSMDITIADDTESETTGSDKHKFVEEMMSRQSHGCPGPPGFQTDLPRSNVTTFSRHRTILQTEVQTPSISRPSNPQGIQGGLFDSNEIQCSMQIIYPPTVPNLQNYPSSSVPMRSNPFYGQDSISKEQQYLELPYRQTGRLLSGVQEQSVPEQDQLISDNNYNQQRKVQGVQAEYDDHEKDLLKSNKREKEKQAVTSEHIKDENGKQSEKRVKFSEDVKIDKSEDSCKDLKDFIKQYVKQEIGSKRSDIKRLCDAVIVYDKNDYEYAFDMKDEIKAMVTKELNEELRIELFDDEKFMQSHVQVVQDVLKNASVVLVYLSNNTGNSRQVQFFIEEAIALTRIGPVDKDGLVSDCEFSVRPVHSQASYKRNYRTPPGLASVSGIDWFDKSKYTYDRIIAIMKNAIRRRKLIENPRQVQDEFRQTMLRTGSMTHQQFHRRNAPQHAWDAGTSAFTTSGPRYTPQATTEPLYRGMNDPTQHGFNISDAESMLRRMSIEPNQGSAASSYTKSGEHFLRSGEEYSQPEYRYVYANVNPSFTPYSEPVEPFGVQQNRAFGPDLGYRTAEEAEFCGCHRIGQFSRIVEQSRFLGHNQMPLNEEPQYRRDGGDEKHVMGLVNDGQKTNTSRTNIRSADGYDATNQPRTRHSAMQQAPGAQRQRPTEYTPRHMQQKTLQQQQKQSRGQMGSGRGIITSEMLISNLSTNDVEIDNPTSTQESRRTYDQGPAVNVYTEETDSSEDELWDPLGNLPGSKGGRVVNIVGSKVLQIGNQNSVTNVGNIVKKDRKQSKEMKAQDKDNESYEDEPKKHLAEFNKNTESDSKPDIRSKDIKHPSNTERLSQKLGNETKQSNVAKSGNDLSDSVNLVCKHNENQKTYDHVEQPAKDVVSGYELNIPLEEPRVHANTDAKGVKDVERYIYDENTRLTATVSYPDLQKMPRSHWSQKIIAGEGHFMTTDGGPSVLLLKSSPNAIDHTHPPVFTNTMTDAHLNSLDENTEVQKLDDYAWTEAYNEETRMFTSNDLSDADLFGYGRHDRQNVGRALFTSRSATSFSDLVNKSLVTEEESFILTNVSDVD
ncbi:uncharacterized protein LOC127832075 isoform X2 [Dreissena polymorpha]|uniref:uncharacterized protein LOC127832075 isoform X2 n=1 Tax=Dreissena polymorpha TaxID=45954 RepID=UPI00226519BF|nr:uncharacterized protein LOC127832075 isoform X2 [Dreissena polymorpha]XP_052213192.1 uncharacterized protein LOC127832075 isoform X2 [Dreissena polymorpha]